MSNRLSVTIAGQTFRVVADENIEYMRKVARIADEKVRESCAAAGGNNFSAGVLAALNIADEMVKTSAELEEMRARLERTDAIEAELKETKDQCALLEQKLAAAERALTSMQAQCAALSAQRTIVEDKLQNAEEALDLLEQKSETPMVAPLAASSVQNSQPSRRNRRKK